MSADHAPLLLVAGETSGEEHAAGLVQALREQMAGSRLTFFGSGGQAMEEQGVELLGHVSRLAAIGPWDALALLPHYWRLYRNLLEQVRRRRPRLAILVDFPEFNLRLARRLKALGVPVCYFISPQIWAWRSARLRLVRRFVDLMLVILPFEEEYYRRHGVEARYVGNPSLARWRALSGGEKGEISSARNQDGPPLVALLPGSRKSEVERIYPLQLDVASFVASRRPVRFWTVRAPSIERSRLLSIYSQWLARGNRPLELKICEEGTQRLLPRVDCAIIKSGTATLEAMVQRVPFAMVYKMPQVSWYLARPWVSAPSYCLANLVAGKTIVPEFVQKEATPEKIGTYLCELLDRPQLRETLRRELEAATARLGEADAYREGARQIVNRFLGSDGPSKDS